MDALNSSNTLQTSMQARRRLDYAAHSLQNIGQALQHEHAPNLTADVTIWGVVYGCGVLQYAFLSAEILKLKTSESSMGKDR